MRALILVERVILPDPVGDEYVQQAIVVVIADGYAHRTLGITVAIDGQARFKARVLECTVTVVNVKEIRTHVVDLIDILKTIVVVVSKRSAHAPFGKAPVRIPDARRFANFRESAVPVISIELVRTKAGDVEIGKPVVVVVADSAAAVPARIPQMGPRRDVGERSVTIVPQEVIVGRFARCLRLARRTVDQENVLITVVVVIKKAWALPVHLLQVLAHFVPADDLHVQTGSLGDIRESRQGEARAIEGLVRRLDWGLSPRG